jgi:hypothetical protein
VVEEEEEEEEEKEEREEEEEEEEDEEHEDRWSRWTQQGDGESDPVLTRWLGPMPPSPNPMFGCQ